MSYFFHFHFIYNWRIFLNSEHPLCIIIFNICVFHRYVCEEHWPLQVYNSYYTIALLVLQFVFPLLVLIYTYTRIAFAVWGKKPPGEAENSRDQRMAKSKRKVRIESDSEIQIINKWEANPIKKHFRRFTCFIHIVSSWAMHVTRFHIYSKPTFEYTSIYIIRDIMVITNLFIKSTMNTIRSDRYISENTQTHSRTFFFILC